VALFAGQRLQVAAGEIDTGGVAIHVRQRVGFGNVGAPFANGNDQFHLVLQIGGGGWKGHGAAARYDRIAGFRKKERRLAIRVSPHFTGVLCVVAAHAVDSPHGKNGLAAQDGNRDFSSGGDGVIGHITEHR